MARAPACLALRSCPSTSCPMAWPRCSRSLKPCHAHRTRLAQPKPEKPGAVGAKPRPERRTCASHSRRVMSAAPDIPLERLLMSPAAFGLTTASSLQRAVCRIIDGLPLGELATCAEVRAAIGDVDALPSSPPAEVL